MNISFLFVVILAFCLALVLAQSNLSPPQFFGGITFGQPNAGQPNLAAAEKNGWNIFQTLYKYHLFFINLKFINKI